MASPRSDGKRGHIRLVRSVTWLLVVILCVGVLLLTVHHATVFGLNTDAQIVLASVCGLLAFWFLVIPVSAKLELGPAVLVKRAAIDCEKMGEDELRQALVAKLGSGRDICSTFASLSVSIIGIVIAVAVLAPRTDSFTRAVLLTATFLLMVSTLTLIHAVDLSDTALSPGLNLSTMMSVRKVASRYYTNGVILLLFAMLTGMSVVSPYLTAACTVAYMLIVSHYYFIWDEILQ